MTTKQDINLIADTTMKAASTITESGLPEEKAAKELWYVYLNALKGLNAFYKTPHATGEVIDFVCGKKTVSSVKAEIKQIYDKKPNGRRQRKKWGVCLTIDNTTIEIPFGGKEQTMIYVCALLRNKIGERMYRHEFINNSKGHKSRLNRKKSYIWLKSVYDALFKSCSIDYNTWINKIHSDNGHALDQGKSQVNNVIKNALKGHPEAISYGTVNTHKDENKDSFYSIEIESDNITIPKDLEFLVSNFYDMVDLKPAE